MPKKPFGHIGGKSKLAKTIINLFPNNYEDMIYVEPFVGGGSIYFKKNPSIKEIINDKDKDIYILMKGFKEYDGNKISAVVNQPLSKEAFNLLKQSNPNSKWGKFIRLLLLKKNSFYSQGNSYDKSTDKINTNYGDKYQERMKHTTILNKDYKTIIKQYDSPNTLFYLDPPYEDSNEYKHSYIDYNELSSILKHIKGKFILSINDSKLIKDTFKGFKIKKVKTQYADPKLGGHPRKVSELTIQ